MVFEKTSEKIVAWYEKVNYKKLMVLPVILLIICTGFILLNYQTTGEFFIRGIDLKGGTQISLEVDKSVDTIDLENYLKKEFGDVGIRNIVGVSGYNILIRASEDVDQEKISKSVEDYGVVIKSRSFEKIGSRLGESFFAQSRLALIIAFVFMGFVVFFIFKNFVPSIAVIFAAFSDIICTLGVMQILGINLSLATFAGLLLVLGYSIDTDILLTTRLVKRREGSITERSIGAMKTGLTMTLTTLVALIVLFFASTAPALQEIATVLIIALLFDIPNTYFMNLGIIRIWLDKKGF